MFEEYDDISPWIYYVEHCGMKRESFDLMQRSVEFIKAHPERWDG